MTQDRRETSSEAPCGSLALLQTQLSQKQQGNSPAGGQICIFLIIQIHNEIDDSAGLVFFFFFFFL